MLIRRLKILPRIKKTINHKSIKETTLFNCKSARYYTEKISVDINESTKSNNSFDLDAHLKKQIDFLYSYSVNNFITKEGRTPTEYKPETAKTPEDFEELEPSSPKVKELNDILLEYKKRNAKWEECYKLIQKYTDNGIKPDYNTVRILRQITENEVRESFNSNNPEELISLPDPVFNESLSKSMFQLLARAESFDPAEAAEEFKKYNPPIDLPMLTDQYYRFDARNRGELFINTVKELEKVGVIDDVLLEAFLNSIKK